MFFTYVTYVLYVNKVYTEILKREIKEKDFLVASFYVYEIYPGIQKGSERRIRKDFLFYFVSMKYTQGF